MSSGNTETRILQMQLENKDFEDGVRQTIKSLESLEEKLNLKNAGDGFQRVSAAANSVQMSHLESGIDAVTNKFTLMGQVGLQVLERVSNKIVDTGEKILRAATIQPMIDGWSEFEMKTGSVQTILGGIRNQFEDQPTAIHAISDALDELNEYADKTIYNFAQMTENVGKFTNQGLNLETSTNAIKGIANWAAAVGANPQQMSRAMYNISQSLGAGSMQLIDWRSIRFANMATPEVKKLFLEVAKKLNPEQVSQEGTVKFGKKVIDIANDFEGSLKAGWLTNEVMAEAFGIYAKAFNQEELINKYGTELGQQFYEMGEYAEEAATKVRTFTQLIGVLKEGLGSGWAQSFDILLGGFEKQTEFFTAIKDIIESITNFQTDDRNAWLQAFSDIGGIESFQQAILKTLDILTDFYWVFNDVISLVVNPFGWTSFNMTDGIFGPKQVGYTEMKSTWYGVKEIFDDINRTLQNFQDWMYKPGKNGRSHIHNLANALSGVAGAAGIAWQVLTGFGKFVFRIFKRFEPLVSAVLDLIGQIGGAIYNVFFNLTGQQTVEKIFDRIEGAIGPVVDIVVGLASAVVDLIHSFLGIDKAADDWTVLGDRMKAFWDIFEYNKDLSFAGNLKNSLKNALVAVFGKDTADSLIKAWDDNIAPVLEQISNFFTEVFDSFNRVIEGLKKAAGADYSKEDSATGKMGIFLNSFLSGYHADDQPAATEAYTNILSIYQEIEQYYNDNVKPHVDSLVRIFTEDLPAINDKIAEFLFGPKSVVADYNGQHLTSHYGNRSGGLFGSIADAFKPENLDSIVKEVEDAWEKFNTVLFGPKSVVANYNGQHLTSHYERNGGIFGSITGFFNSETWAKDWALIEGAFNSVSNWITTKGQQAWKIIMDFLFGPEVVVANRNGQNLTSHYERQGGAYEAAISFLTPVWDWLESTGKKLYEYITTHDFKQMWDGLNDLLFGYDAEVKDESGRWRQGHIDGVLTPLVTVLQPIAEVFEQVKGWALEKLGSIDWGGIWESIGRFFGGWDEAIPNDVDPTKFDGIEHHEGVFERIINFFDRIIDYFQSPEFQAFWGQIKTFYHEHIEPALNWIGGLGKTIFGAFGDLFSGKGFGGFGAAWEYLKEGATSLFKDFDLGGLLGGEGGSIIDMLIPGLSEGKTPTTAEAGKGGGFSLLDLVLGTADAAEADGAAIADAANSIVASLDQTGKDTEKATEEGTDIMSSLLGSVSKFLPYLGGAAAIGLVGKVGDMITGITGNRKPTILEQISGLLTSLGEPLKGFGIALAGAGFAELIKPGTIDKTFGHLKDILDKVFGWLKELGLWGVGSNLVSGLLSGGASALGSWLGGGRTKFSAQFNWSSGFADIITNLGQAIQGLMNGVKAIVDLAKEFVVIDLFFDEYDKDGNFVRHGFDDRLNRVLEFVKTVLETITLNGSTILTEIFTLANTAIEGAAAGFAANNGNTDYSSKGGGLSSTLLGLAGIITAVCDGAAAVMTASIVPGIMNVDIDKLSGFITSVLNSLTLLATILEGGALLSLIQTPNWWQPLVLIASSGAGLGLALAAIGGIGKILLDWYMSSVTENLAVMAPTIYSFISNIIGVIQMISSLGDTQMGSAEKILSEDLPRLIGYVNSDKLGFDKDRMNEVGIAIRDFGNRISNGIGSLARAKEVFDKYNANSQGQGFPIEFFQEMTEALTYLQGDGIEELYDSVFGKGGFFVGNTGDAEQKINGLNTFFTTIGHLGSVIVEHSEKGAFGLSNKTTELVSAKEGLDAFQDAFSGIKDSLHTMIADMNTEGFSIEKINAFGDFLKKISDAGYTFSKTFYYESGVVKTYEMTSPITQFSGWLQTMGTGVRQLNDSLKVNGKYDIDYTQLESALNALKPMAEIEKTIYDYSKLTNSEYGSSRDWDWMANTRQWIDLILPQMQSIGTNLHSMAAEIKPEDVTSLTSASGTLTSLASFMSADLYPSMQTMTAEQIGGYASAFTSLGQSLIMPANSGNTIADTIGEIMTATGGKQIQVKITPVIDDSDIGANLPDGLDMKNTYSRMINMQLNMSDVQNVRVDAAQIQAIVASNNEIRTGISDLSAAIRQIKIQVNAPSPAYGPSRGTTLVYPLMPNYQAVP